LSGIPGQVGATPIQNVGAYGQEVKHTISKVHCLDRQTLQDRVFDNAECGFAYRTSRFKEEDVDRYVICEVEFLLRRGSPQDLGYQDLRERVGTTSPTVDSVRHAVLSARREKSMVLDPSDENGRSCGSFFLNPVLTEGDFDRLRQRVEVQTPGIEIPRYPQSDGSVKLPAAWLIERAGLSKGYRVGHVGLSTKHALCIVAREGATSAEIREFARFVKATVLQALGVELHPEPRFVGFAPP
jgi:UDP-N-acetylmuramate dehydrogenase